jgi:membrane-bound serine protease (ClpP class)
MKILRLLFLLLAALPVPLMAAEPVVCVVTVREDISRNTTFLIRRALKQAVEQKAEALIIELDTNGGRVSDTEQILVLLQHAPCETYTFINTKAYSAGAFIAAGTDDIYMAPASVIGAATPVMLMPGGSGMAELPKSYEEKITSAMRALIRSTAQKKGHNPDVFEAMVDKDIGLSVAGTNLCEKGKLLTLTYEEAAREYGTPPKPLLSAGTMDSLDELLTTLDLDGARVVKVEPYGFEVLARWLTVISPLLMTIGILAIYAEMKAPGLGIPSVIAAVAFGLYFLGYFAAGMAGWEEIALFAVGAILLAVEIFVIPGFGVAGIAGILCIVGSLLLAGVERWPGAMWPTWTQWQPAIINVGIGFAGTLVFGALLVRWLPQTSVFQRLELGATLHTATSSRSEAKSLLGAVGVADTVLRPAGKGKFGDRLVDVVTEGDFIQKNEQIKIIAVEGSRVVVTKWT